MKHRGHRQHGWSTRRVQGVCAALVLPLALGAGIGVAAPSVVHAQGAQATVGELVEQAQQLEAKKQFEAAAARYEAALKRRPDDDELRGHVARLRSWTGQLDTAVALYRDMLTRTPADIDLRIALARVLSWQKQFQESETLFRDVRAEAPANLDAAQGLADTLTWSGRPAEALPLYEQVHRETHDAELGQRIASIKSELDAEAKAAAQAAAQAAEQERAEASQRAAADQLDKQVVAARELSWKQ
ncbi:MAG: tetratricopeptide repeat protein, partial [Nitrospiraceae bacterium]